MASHDHSDIFVSYARPDRARVMPLVDTLESRGWRVFWDHDIPPGWTWDEYIGARLEQARVVLVVWSSDSVTSEFVRTEAARARKRRAMVPVRIDEVDPPVEFERVHAADLIEWARATQGEVPQALLQELARRLPQPPPPDAGAKAQADGVLAVQEKLRQSEAAREALAVELKAVREALGAAGRELESRQMPPPTSTPLRKPAAKTPWRWSELDLLGRIGIGIGAVLTLIVIGSLIQSMIRGIR